jgi:hypothetical protein
MGTSWSNRSKPSTSFTNRSKPTTNWNTEESFELLQENGSMLFQEDSNHILLENNTLITSWSNRTKP